MDCWLVSCVVCWLGGTLTGLWLLVAYNGLIESVGNCCKSVGGVEAVWWSGLADEIFNGISS